VCYHDEFIKEFFHLINSLINSRNFFTSLSLIVFLLATNILNAQSLLPLYNKGIIQVEKDWEIGGDVADENYIFTHITRISIDSEGKLFVLDTRENCIKIFDSNGKYLKTYGREGGGPGELLQPLQMAVDPEDNIVIYELGNRRFSVYNNIGTHLYTLSFQKIVHNFSIGPNGKYYIEIHENDWSGQKDGSLYKISQFTPDLKREIVIDSARILDNKYFKSGNLGGNIPMAFHSKIVWSVSPSGKVVVARSEDYSIKIFSSNLELVKEIHHKDERIKVTKQEKENVLNNVKPRGRVPDYILKQIEFPVYKPYFSNLNIDHEGYILVQTYKKEDQNMIFDVFTKEGKFVNKVSVPAIIVGSLFKKEYFYQINVSEDEFPKIIRYHLVL
jgi:WD40 repeat protein